MSAAIQGIYVALFGRPADPGGLAYWAGVTKNGADLSEMLRVLPSLAEYTDRFAGQTPDQVITTVYQNLFGRAPDAEGLAFFKGQLASGAQTLATIAVNIMQGAQGDDKADVQAKIDAAQLFTASLDTPEEIAAYAGNDAAALAKKFLDTVDKDAPATPESVEKASTAVVAGEDPTGGQAPNPGPGGPGGDDNSSPDPQFVNTYGDLEATFGADELYAGGGNSAQGFFKSTNAAEGLELGLDARFDQNSEDLAPVSLGGKTYVVPVNLAYDLRFAYSVANLKGELDLDRYDIKLTVIDGATQQTHVLNLGPNKVDGTYKNNADSKFDWYLGDEAIIVDDGGSASVTQNIQRLDLTDTSYAAGDQFQVKLEAFLKGTSTLAASTSMNVMYEAASSSIVNFDGSSPGHTATTSAEAVDGIFWVEDRKKPGNFAVQDGEIVLTIDASGVRADTTDEAILDGRAVPYYSYQGYTLTDGDGKLGITINETHSASITFDFFIDSAWAEDGGLEQAVSFWPFPVNSDGNTFYPIIDYVDADAATTLKGRWNDDDALEGTAGFRIWDSTNPGSWGHFTPVEEGLKGWVTMQLQIEHDQLTWTVRQEADIIATFTQQGSTKSLESFAFQGLNFGEVQSYKIDNLRVDSIAEVWDFK